MSFGVDGNIWGLEWEQVDDYHKRARVPGGWLVKTFENVWDGVAEGRPECGHQWRVAMCYVPDPERQWRLS